MNKNQSVIQLINYINKNTSNNQKIKKKQKILIPISGGQDSVCLFFIFIHLKKQWKWSFGIIYCNHLWHQNSFYSGSLIIKIAYLFVIPIYYTVSSNKIFKEKSSRYWRYNFFYRLSFFYQYQIIYIGHTLNDKLETSLFQNIRGSSLNNLFLYDIKYFYSNSKFIKNTKIKTIQFYSFYLLNKNKRKKYKYKKWYYTRSFFYVQYKINDLFLHQLILTTKNFCKNYLNNQILYSSLNKLNSTKYYLSLTNKPWVIKKYSKNLRTLQNHTIFSQINIYSVFVYPLSFIVRPILLLNRFDLKKLLLFFELPLYPDISNQKKIYYRNRIRKELLPTLKFFFNPQIEKSFFQFETIRIQEKFQLNLLFKRLIREFYLYDTKNFQSEKKHLRSSSSGSSWSESFFYGENFVDETDFTKQKYLAFLFDWKTNYTKCLKIRNDFFLKQSSANQITFKLNTLFLLNLPIVIQRKVITQFLKNITTTQIQFINVQNTINLIEKSIKYKYIVSNCKLLSNNLQIKIQNKKQFKFFQFWFLNQFKNFYFLNSVNLYKNNVEIKTSHIKKSMFLNCVGISNKTYIYNFQDKVDNYQTRKTKKIKKFINQFDNKFIWYFFTINLYQYKHDFKTLQIKYNYFFFILFKSTKSLFKCLHNNKNPLKLIIWKYLLNKYIFTTSKIEKKLFLRKFYFKKNFQPSGFENFPREKSFTFLLRLQNKYIFKENIFLPQQSSAENFFFSRKCQNHSFKQIKSNKKKINNKFNLKLKKFYFWESRLHFKKTKNFKKSLSPQVFFKAKFRCKIFFHADKFYKNRFFYKTIVIN